tara:strand:- start:89 stop:292 length:204 start_codon:yes stop_codon:yes gene_type:complete
MNVKINKDIAKRLQKRVDESNEFKNIEEYVHYVLSQVVEKLGEEEKTFSKEDEEKVKKRLQGLGYLD